MLRIPGLEMAIFAQGRLEFADSFEEHDPGLRPAMIELQTLLAYEKQFRNLQLPEARLHRRREKDAVELNKLQQARQAKEAEAVETAAPRSAAAKNNSVAFDLPANGFEFSTAEIG